MYSHCDGSLLVTLSFISRISALRHMCKRKKNHSKLSFFFFYSPKLLSAFSITCTNKIGIWHCAVVAIAVTINWKLYLFYFEAVRIQHYSKLCFARNAIMWHFRCSQRKHSNVIPNFVHARCHYVDDTVRVCVHKIVHNSIVYWMRHWIIIFTVKKWTSVSRVHKLTFYLHHETSRTKRKIEINSWFVSKLHRSLWNDYTKRRAIVLSHSAWRCMPIACRYCHLYLCLRCAKKCCN